MCRVTEAPFLVPQPGCAGVSGPGELAGHGTSTEVPHGRGRDLHRNFGKASARVRFETIVPPRRLAHRGDTGRNLRSDRPAIRICRSESSSETTRDSWTIVTAAPGTPRSVISLSNYSTTSPSQPDGRGPVANTGVPAGSANTSTKNIAKPPRRATRASRPHRPTVARCSSRGDTTLSMHSRNESGRGGMCASPRHAVTNRRTPGATRSR